MNGDIDSLPQSVRVARLKKQMFREKRYVSMEQAKIITRVYRANTGLPRNALRALALKESLAHIPIRIQPGELVVG
ncbi:MAG: hypothetical protein FWG37_04990, partial [Clostridia bacterium]|nr:hypothetical protein [Clostridia bacterium]